MDLYTTNSFYFVEWIPDIEHLAEAVGSDWLIQHKNKDVRLLVACALADILRIYAPDPPYGEDTRSRTSFNLIGKALTMRCFSVAAIRLFLKILRGFESPDMTPQHPSYRYLDMLCKLHFGSKCYSCIFMFERYFFV
jgi:hypothetical protein